MTKLNKNREGAEIVKTYHNGKYHGIIWNDTYYLTLANSDDLEQIIVSFDKDMDGILNDIDLAKCFINHSLPKMDNLDNLSTQKLIMILMDLLKDDFRPLNINTELLNNDFDKIFRQFKEKHQNTIIEALRTMKVIDENNKSIMPFRILKDKQEMRRAKKELLPFMKLCTLSQHYDICERTLDGGYIIIAKNGGCGSHNAIANDKEHKMLIVFDKRCNTQPIMSEKMNPDLKHLILQDLKSTPYQVANRFVKFEEKLSKKYDIVTEKITDKIGFIDGKLLKYPNLDDETNGIANLIRKGQSSNENIDQIINDLSKLYLSADAKLKESAQALKELIKTYEL